MKTFLLITSILIFAAATFGQVNHLQQAFESEPVLDCQYRLDPPIKSVTGAPQEITVTVTTAEGCAWTAVSNVSWITVKSGASGIGSGTVILSISGIGTIQRRGFISAATVSIAGRVFTANLQSGCSYALSETSANFGNGGGIGSATVIAPEGCALSALNDESFITITNQSTVPYPERQASVSYTVSFTVAPNISAAKTGVIYIAGQPFIINQAGGKSRKRARFF
jgi:hypothetical protein